jgi:hypothetical protein
MAGKTFPGIGDLEDEVPPLDPADAADSSNYAQSHYSGPTVVDDAKVEQGLKKLRSLDAPPGPLTGIHQAIVEVLADPARATPAIPVPAELLMPEITIDPSRGTAVGRSVSGPVVGQQTTAPFDDRALRGTMFGHGVHLPDLAEARRAMLVETSTALAVVERGVATTSEITVFQPGTYPQRSEIPLGREPPPPRSNRFQSQDTPIALRTVSPKKLVTRVAAAAAGIAAIVVAALLWVRSSDEADLGGRAPVAVPVPRPPKAVEVQQLAAPPAPPPSTPAPQPAPMASATAPTAAPSMPAAKPPASTVARRAAATPPNDDDLAAATVPAETSPTRPSSPAESTGRRPRSASAHSDRHRSAASSEAGGAPKPDEAAKPDKLDKPVRGKRPVEEDPDATMAPSIE